MNYADVASRYRQTSAQCANPVGWVVRLYDTILDDLRKAAAAQKAGHIEARTSALNHALLVIAELEGVLDHQRGGQVARHLQGLYRVSRALIVEANAHASAEKIDKLITMFLPVRQAWQQVEHGPLPAELTVGARVPRTRFETTQPDGRSSRWSG